MRKVMSLKTAALLSVATSIAAISAGPAQAIIHVTPNTETITTYTGIVTSSYIYTGPANVGFGFGGGVGDSNSLVGQLVTEVFFTNDANGAATYNAPYSSELEGAANRPAVSSIVTVGGHQIDLVAVHTYDTDSQANRSTLTPGGQSQVYDLSSGYSSTFGGYSYAYTYADVESYVTPISASFDYHSPLSYTVQPGDETQGSVTYDAYEGSIYREEDLDFAVTNVNVSSNLSALSLDAYYFAVPEPSTWAMMLVGFGGIGVALRRRPIAA